MFAKYVYEKSPALFAKRILITDFDKLNKENDFLSYFKEKGFAVIKYTNDLDFRINHTESLNDKDGQFILYADKDSYIPYDIRKQFELYEVTLSSLFSKLNAAYLAESRINLDLLSMAYKECFDNYSTALLTEQFIKEKVQSTNNIKEYVRYIYKSLCKKVEDIADYLGWLNFAKEKAELMTLATEYGLDSIVDDGYFDEYFINYVLKNYGTLSSKLSNTTPVLVSKAMEYMSSKSKKFAVIVMDGMSEFDWKIISESFSDLKYNESGVFAMIPTTTSVSRQCLLSNKYPNHLLSPWTQAKEKEEFVNCAKSLGYQSSEIEYHRGYDASFGLNAKCVAIVINDVDDIVHGQTQGREGMLNQMRLLARKRELKIMVKSILSSGMDVYITADHGNTPCVGTGKVMGAGVDVETKSRRMLVLKDFADKEALIEKYGVYEYPPYYLNKEYTYMICPIGKSLDSKGEDVMTHGGISVDEVIVPFISLKAGDNNG